MIFTLLAAWLEKFAVTVILELSGSAGVDAKVFVKVDEVFVPMVVVAKAAALAELAPPNANANADAPATRPSTNFLCFIAKSPF
ncbi:MULTISPECIES: hypothetical protein [unclassified Microbacterium]|uniref:hypothetical protein n=1 Tax=unclassified Microbacterium TaxID=2609290 RepID=UPI00197B436A|nr:MULTISPECIES: hypothetical protein [unclassified Microbacterium]MEA1262462.1 hypothetical protein [Microbacterium sp. STF-2]